MQQHKCAGAQRACTHTRTHTHTHTHTHAQAHTNTQAHTRTDMCWGIYRRSYTPLASKPVVPNYLNMMSLSCGVRLSNSLQPSMICSSRVSSNCFRILNYEIIWHPKAVGTQGNLGACAEPDKSMYHFCLQGSAHTTFSRRGSFEESKLFQNRMMHLN